MCISASMCMRESICVRVCVCVYVCKCVSMCVCALCAEIINLVCGGMGGAGGKLARRGWKVEIKEKNEFYLNLKY